MTYRIAPFWSYKHNARYYRIEKKGFLGWSPINGLGYLTEDAAQQDLKILIKEYEDTYR